MYLSSTDSRSLMPNNLFDDFTIELLREYVFTKQQWVFALTEISVSGLEKSLRKLPESVTVLCNLANESYICEQLTPVLRSITAEADIGASLYQNHYISVNSLWFNKVRIYLRNQNLQVLDRKLWAGEKLTLKCTLHFQAIGY